ncbi:MAG TPA: hypothetical protein PLO98_08700 [Bacteroidia bacterium]|nr:hypothetical protein [Bacteroidia bacterium]
MKQKISSFFTLGIAISIFLITACNSQPQRKTKEKDDEEISQTKKSDYELADEFLTKLKKEKTDTIIFYKRTCIDCCDFFNIFWSSNGQRHLTKFYFDNMKSHSMTIDLKADTVFNFLSKNFTELKTSPLKGNGHKRKDGTTTLVMIDHYCYAQLNIYTKQDSIITDRMKDHDFDKYTDFGFDPTINKGKRELNDSYEENITSKWNSFLTSIENQIATMPETINGEKETLRTRKSDR